MPTTQSVKTISLAAALAALGAAGALAAGSGGDSGDVSTSPADATTARTDSPQQDGRPIDQDVRRFAGVFRRDQEPSDRQELSGPAVAAMAREHGAQFGDSRRVAKGLPDVDVWLVPAEDAICILYQPRGNEVEGPGGTCQTLAGLAEGHGVLTVRQGNVTTIVGAAADGVAEVELELGDGSTRTLSVTDNAYAAQTSAGTRSIRVGKQAQPASDGGE